MNKNYDWNETNTGVTITFPLLYKIDKKKFDYTITDSYIKLNLYQMKQFHFIDLMGEVDVDSSKIVFEENKIIFNLSKKENGLWKKLESNLPKEELKERRKKANERLEESIKQKRELATNKKKEFEKFVVDQSIKIDDERREEIRTKKEEEKTAAEKDLYKFVNKIDNRKVDEDEDEDDINKEKNKENINKEIEESKNNEDIEEENKTDNKEDKDNDSKNNKFRYKLEEDPYKNEEEVFKREEIKDPTPIKHSIESRRNQIFSDEEKNKNKNSKEEKPLVIDSPMVTENNFQNTLKALINKEEKKKEPPKPQPTNIRKQETIKVNLTKKMIPTFAARESLAKEPPYPKSKKYVPEKNYLGQEIDEKNPIWAKQKGDNFYNNKDYRSAINAYNTALDLDPNFHKVLINRGTSYMCLGEFDLALNDFNRAIDLINAIDKKERSDAFYDRINVKALSKMYAVYALRQEYQKALDIINEKLLLKEHAFPFIIPEDKWKKIEKDKILIESRMKNEKLKENGDKLLREKKLDEAEKIYKEILEIEPENERVLSNLSMIYLMKGKHDEVISICSKILGIFSKFKERIFRKRT